MLCCMTLLVSCSDKSELQSLEEDKLYPNEWIMNQRIYPNQDLDYKYIRKTRKQAKNLLVSNASRSVQPEWQLVGPQNIGGRITDIAISPDNDDHFYIGTSVGGLFRTLDRGETWTCVTDPSPDNPFIEPSVGNIAIAPTNANRIYLGTGEANGSGTSGAFFGNGLFRSDDAGNTWESIGLESSGHVGRIVVDPSDENRLFVAATGTLYGKNEDRGLYRSLDGGDNWEKVLYVNDSTACIDVAMNPANTDILYASTWERIRYPFTRRYGGPGSAVYKSTDGGDTWEKLSNGLPESNEDTGRIGLAISESDPNVVYISYTTNKITNVFDGLYKSEDNGASFTEVAQGQIDNVNASFGWFFGNVRVNPNNEDDVFVLGQRLYRGNFPVQSVQEVEGMHVDHHAMEFSRNNPNMILSGNDGGVYISEDAGQSWIHFKNLPITQFYNIEVSEFDSKYLYGGTQDNNTLMTSTGSNDDWFPILGGDGFHVNVDPDEPNIVYAEYQYGNLFKSVTGGPDMSYALEGVDENDRTNWNTPVVLSPFNPDLVYYGSNRLYVSYQAELWEPISPDLTNGSVPGGFSSYGTLTAIAGSYQTDQVIYTGSDDGRVHRTVNGGQDWEAIDEDLPTRYVSQIAVHPDNDDIAFVAFSGYGVLDYTPHVYFTSDGGSSWTDISWNLPDIPVNDIIFHSELEALIIGTDMGIWINFDYENANWQALGTGQPNSIVSDLRWHAPTNVVYAGTFGRSIYSIDMSEVSDTSVGITDSDVQPFRVKIGPNPSSGSVMLSWDWIGVEEAVINISDLQGRNYLNRRFDSTGGNNFMTTLDLSELPSGTYIIRLEMDDQLLTEKLILQ